MVLRVLRDANRNKRSFNKKILLLKKKQIEQLFQERPWNQDALLAILDKYVDKLKFKEDNKIKIQRAVVRFLSRQEESDSFIRAETWKHMNDCLDLCSEDTLKLEEVLSNVNAAEQTEAEFAYIEKTVFDQGLLTMARRAM